MSLDDLFEEIEGDDILVEQEPTKEVSEYKEFIQSCERLEKLTKSYGSYICLPVRGEQFLEHYVVPLEKATYDQLKQWVDTYCPHIGITTPLDKISKDGIFNLVALKNSNLKIPIQKE